MRISPRGTTWPAAERNLFEELNSTTFYVRVVYFAIEYVLIFVIPLVEPKEKKPFLLLEFPSTLVFSRSILITYYILPNWDWLTASGSTVLYPFPGTTESHPRLPTWPSVISPPHHFSLLFFSSFPNSAFFLNLDLYPIPRTVPSRLVGAEVHGVRHDFVCAGRRRQKIQLPTLLSTLHEYALRTAEWIIESFRKQHEL